MGHAKVKKVFRRKSEENLREKNLGGRERDKERESMRERDRERERQRERERERGRIAVERQRKEG